MPKKIKNEFYFNKLKEIISLSQEYGSFDTTQQRKNNIKFEVNNLVDIIMDKIDGVESIEEDD